MSTYTETEKIRLLKVLEDEEQFSYLLGEEYSGYFLYVKKYLKGI